jgi:hypothetical protein
VRNERDRQPGRYLPEIRATPHCGRLCAACCLAAGLHDVPEAPAFESRPVPQHLEPEMLFSQTCGYPLETVYRGQAIRSVRQCTTLLGARAPLIAPFFWSAAPGRRIADLKGGVFLLNSPVPQPGHELAAPRLHRDRRGAALFPRRNRDQRPPCQPRPAAARRWRCSVNWLRDLRVLATLPPQSGRPVADCRENPTQSGDPVCDLGGDAARDRRNLARRIAQSGA